MAKVGCADAVHARPNCCRSPIPLPDKGSRRRSSRPWSRRSSDALSTVTNTICAPISTVPPARLPWPAPRGRGNSEDVGKVFSGPWKSQGEEGRYPGRRVSGRSVAADRQPHCRADRQAVIVQKVRDAERKRQFEEYRGRAGEIVNGLVKRIEFGNVVVDLGRAEALLRRDEAIPREHFNNGDRIRAYILDVREEVRGPQIFLSRTHPRFMAKLFSQEVPEIYDGIIEIKAVARDQFPSQDRGDQPITPSTPSVRIDMRGSRVQAVVGELQAKIDIQGRRKSPPSS